MIKRYLKRVAERAAPNLLHRYQIGRKRESEPEILLLASLCRLDALSIDVGANRGLYSHYMLPHSAGVVAFEPLPVMHDALTRFFGKRITAHRVALSDHEGECQIRLPRGNPSWATIDRRNTLALANKDELDTFSVAVQRLDSFQFDRVGLIKIDVEGHEEAVIRGAIDTITRNRPNLIIEIEERHNEGSIGRVTGLLEGLGYRGFFIDSDAIRPLSEFDASRDQPAAHVCVSGKTGRYINNFIFKAN